MMGKIFYSVAGEGRGHAARVRTIVEELRHENDVVLFAPHAAFEFLDNVYHDSLDVQVRRIPGLQFCYRNRRVSYLRSIWQSGPFLLSLHQMVNAMEKALDEERPDLIITDFEPILPRAARRLGLPFLSFDHQHFLTTFDLSSLPWPLWLKAKSIAASIDLFYTGQAETIVSSFFSPDLRRNVGRVTSVGVMLRRELQNVRPSDAGHLLVYLRRFAPPRLMEALRRCDREIYIYGLGEQPRDGNLRYFEVNETGFFDDLINCHALISNAGNQLVGEALCLRKPVLALPEEGNFEQMINGHFLAQTGYGVNRDALVFDDSHLNEFLDRVPQYRQHIRPDAVIGNADALTAIRRHLPIAVPMRRDVPRVA
jgi:uncharacterized protein (TIGR00661 family)